MSHRIRPPLPLILGLAAVAVVGAACVPAAGEGAAPASSPATVKTAEGIPAGTVINVGDQQQDLQTLFQASGALAGAPYRVNFVEFASGPLVNAGFAAHRIDVGFMGDLPASLAIGSGLPVEAVAVDRPIGPAEYLLAQPGIRSIAQLRGKPVAYTTGTAEQAFALRALASAGLVQEDVQQVDVSLEQLGTVLESGSAAASVVSVEQKVDYQQTHPTAKVLATVDTVSPPTYGYFLATAAALGNPSTRAAITDFTLRLVRASNWQRTHQSRWVQAYYVTVEHQTSATARLILAAGGTEEFVPITAEVQSALQNVVDLEAGAGAIRARFRVTPLFNPTTSHRYNDILKEVPQNG